MPNIARVLIANRGEIAMRVLRSVQAAGLEAVAVYSDVDANAPHVHSADHSVALGGSLSSDSYLDIDKIIAAAQTSGADAIHPGYGFLSENAAFARACAAANIVFIGPPVSAIELMGSKQAAKTAVEAVDVPCIPGYNGADQSDAALIAAAATVGYPLMVKAAAGGGGRGMRLVSDAAALPVALDSARLEARNAFGDDTLILERAITGGRHIEVQVLADGHGNVIHLGERDCSLQRRHQKVMEEAPSPFVDAELRALLGAAAIRAARACDYRGVGTVEFLVNDDRSFYFLEMNTRLQVEHPVTELVTGIDLVDQQLRVAAGETLSLAQEDVKLSGHAIEARLYAEDPAAGFLPQTGALLRFSPAQGAGVRVDHSLNARDSVSPFYDAMIAKVIVYAEDRQTACRRLERALGETVALGLRTNLSFLSTLVRDQRFAGGTATTDYIDAELDALIAGSRAPGSAERAIAAALLFECQCPTSNELRHWSNTAPTPRHRLLEFDEQSQRALLTATPSATRVDIDDTTHEVQFTALDRAAGSAAFVVDGLAGRAEFAFVAQDVDQLPRLCVQFGAEQIDVTDATYRPPADANAEGSGRITASTEGQVVALNAQAGDRVEQGSALVIIEAMKMEHRHLADGDGAVASVEVEIGQQVRKGDLLMTLTLDTDESGDSE
ncbi:MAG: acetyl-CoA carboxylase biotin carboxylase subunit [Pseudomonadota bacterium]